MKRQAILCITFLGVWQNLGALLSPLAQSSVEIKAILDDKKFSEWVGAGEKIEKIKKNKEGYQVETSHSKFYVRVVSIPSHKIGPQQFQLEFEELEEKSKFKTY
ncbi:hypothetical protein [Parachlamydia sp. AcF125]|uniref:hypothetical protein n=1 Tax=Parachlamydia sp. AcF125 TaxID=2795736 RepID=UPI001BC9CD37|nr:hypothetical protein [Parachlamydia sp. AcF125]MBS4168251.1 hypothetical protein [Parachlamydia sp. AcF125]